MSSYAPVDRALHWLALDSDSIRHVTFEIERSLTRIDPAAVRAGRHVFIAGLARAGTSILLRLLASSGEFAVQTYRDMPFVLAPSLWHRISRRHRRQAVTAERAHMDGLHVGFDSVEAFEEVFWLTRAGEAYVRADHLLPHGIDDELAEDFATFVGLVVTSRPGTSRYLSKNNNNILRLAGIAASLPRSHILIPFRQPVQQALSLRKQHLRFSASQAADPFEMRYMTWLGHFEFGLNHRPFRFSKRSMYDAHTVNYWLDLWARTYAGVLEAAPASTSFFDSDAFFAEPGRIASVLSSQLEVATLDAGIVGSVAPPKPHEAGEAIDPRCLEAALETYRALRARAENCRFEIKTALTPSC